MLIERLETALRAPRKADPYFTRLLIYMTILYIIFLLSFSSNRWVVSSSYNNLSNNNITYQNQGLWEYCRSALDRQCCASLDKIIGSSVPAFLEATRIFMAFAFVTQTCCLLFLLYKIFVSGVVGGYDKRIIRTLYSATGVCIFLSISIYGGRYKLSDWTAHYSLHWSFGFGIVSLLLTVGVPLLDHYS